MFPVKLFSIFHFFSTVSRTVDLVDNDATNKAPPDLTADLSIFDYDHCQIVALISLQKFVFSVRIEVS